MSILKVKSLFFYKNHEIKLKRRKSPVWYKVSDRLAIACLNLLDIETEKD
jgi:hypothetical protein